MTHRDLHLTLVTSFLASLFLGFVTLPIWWFFVYAFADRVTPTMHLTFLAGMGVLGLVALIVSLAFAGALAAPERRQVAFAVAGATTALVFLGALAVGTVISLLNEDQGSITADQPDAPFVALVAACVFVAALLVLWATRRVRHR